MRPRCSRCAARSTCRCPTSRRSTSARPQPGLSTFMNPRNTAAGTIRQLDPALTAQRPLSMWAYAIGAVEGLALPDQWEVLEWLREHGFPVNREIVVLDDEEEVVAQCLEWQRAPRRARLRDRRRRRQGLRLRAAAAARLGRARSALGGGLEVPADDGEDEADRRALERRQVRGPASLRGARAGPRRRRHGADRDTPQRGGPRAQGPPRGRRGDRPSRRRRDPPGRLAGAARRRAPRPQPPPRAPSAARSARRRRSSPRGRCSRSARTPSARAASGSC